MKILCDIRIEAGDWGDVSAWQNLAETAVTAAAARADAEIVPRAEVSILLTDDAHIRLLNRDYRGFDKPTNVLSFPQNDPEAEGYGPLLGDIVIAHETVAREAAAEDLSFRHHLTHMIVHGFLHLIGYDHLDAAEADEMERLETAVLAALDIPDPYADPPAWGEAAEARGGQRGQ